MKKIIGLCLCLSFCSGLFAEKEPGYWTLMFYGAADNDCENDIMHYIQRMKNGFKNNRGVELILYLDRAPGYSDDKDVLGENFQDTRLYRIREASVERIDGGSQFPEITKTSSFEANTGDANTLKKFIRFGKARFPARNYGLIFFSHGDGKSMCFDEGSDNDALYPAELTHVLTEKESVDFMGMDVCSMSAIENLYEWRPAPGKFGTDVLVASPPVSAPWPYDHILRRILGDGETSDEKDSVLGGRERRFKPEKVTARDLAAVVLEEVADYTHLFPDSEPFKALQAWAVYDLKKANAVKRTVDDLAVSLVHEKEAVEAIRGRKEPLTMNYMYGFKDAWTRAPYFDLYDLARRIHQASNFHQTIRTRAEAVMKTVDDLVLYSFGLSGHQGFQAGRNGVYLVFPDERVNKDGVDFTSWYSAASCSGPRSYGQYSWLGDRSNSKNQTPDNWYELLKFWYVDGSKK